MGKPETPAGIKIHLISFGMARRYRDSETERHVSYCRKLKSHSGTAWCMSINTLLGREQSRRGDRVGIRRIIWHAREYSHDWIWRALSGATHVMS